MVLVKKYIKKIALAAALILPVAAFSQLPAFPGAEGFGAGATGGRGGKVIAVTNLNDGGAGSLRAAIQSYGARTIVFRVAGTIALNSTLKIENGDVTIAGQTAPGEGITLKNYSLRVNASNVIIRYIRSRMGDEKATEDDAMSGRYQNDVILDHCSLSWSTDECGSFYDNTNFTMQYCLLSESLYKSVHDKGNHGYGGIWGGKGASFHHNLLAHHTSRNPRFNGARYHGVFEDERVDYRNNVVYNWGFNSAYAGEGGYINLINNYYKNGPATNSNVRYRLYHPDPYNNDAEPEYDGKYSYLYVDGNVMTAAEFATNDNWKYAIQGPSTAQKEEMKLDEPIEVPAVTTQTASVAYEILLANVGCVLPKRDEIDVRIINETRTGTAHYGGAFGAGDGIIDTQATVGGWPTLETGTPPDDGDHDGMPDAWEDANALDKTDPSDRNNTNDEGYTMLEVYLNSLVVAYEYVIRPLNLSAEETANKEVTLTWEEYSDNETGFVIERKSNDSWSEVGTVNANDTSFVDNSAPDYGDYYYRLKAITDNVESFYTDSVDVTLNPTTNIDKLDVVSLFTLSPNPAVDQTVVRYYLQEKSYVKAGIYDLTGRQVNVFVKEIQPQGSFAYTLNTAEMNAGTYLVKLTAGNKAFVKKIIVTK